LNLVLEKHKGRAIEDDALLKQGALLTRLGDYRDAENSLIHLLSTYPESLLIDECLFSLGKLYEDHLGEIDKAKEMYERIIFEYPSSIYLVEARKAFRRLRGDDL
jgi:TolA-binding protein